MTKPGVEGQFDGYRQRVRYSKVGQAGPLRIKCQQRAFDDFDDGLLECKCHAHHQARHDEHLDEHPPKIFDVIKKRLRIISRALESQKNAANSFNQSPRLQSGIGCERIRIDNLPCPNQSGQFVFGERAHLKNRLMLVVIETLNPRNDIPRQKKMTTFVGKSDGRKEVAQGNQFARTSNTRFFPEFAQCGRVNRLFVDFPIYLPGWEFPKHLLNGDSLLPDHDELAVHRTGSHDRGGVPPCNDPRDAVRA